MKKSYSEMQYMQIANQVMSVLALRIQSNIEFTKKDLVLDFFKTTKDEYNFYKGDDANSFVRIVEIAVESLSKIVAEAIIEDLVESEN